MKLLLVAIVLLAIAWFFVGCTDIREDDNTTVVHAGQQWGHVEPPYVIAADMFTTTTTAHARSKPRVRTASVGAPVVAASSINGYPCGGTELPPCAVMWRESRGDPNAYNPRGCNGHGCYGLWQFSGEWACHFGLSCDIAHWTPEEQTHAARTLWDHGRGCAHWSAC